MILGALLGLLLIWIFHYAICIFICKHDFPIDVAFEFIKRTSISNFKKSKNEIKTGYSKFDEAVYISCDIGIIKDVLQDESIRRSILEIIQEENVMGIYISNGKIKVRQNGIGRDKKQLIKDLENRLNSKVLELKKRLIDALNMVIQNAEKKNLSNAKKIESSIKRMGWFCAISFVVGSNLIMNNYAVQVGEYYYYSAFSFIEILGTSIAMFMAVMLFIWLKLKNTVRWHLLFNKIIFLLIPACLISGISVLNIANIVLDSSEAITTEETIRLKTWSMGKGTNFDLYIDEPNNKILPQNSPIRISRETYFDIKSKEVLKFSVRKGYLGQPYFSVQK